jgi:hypothetical protein
MENTFKLDRPGFSVSVDGGFVDQGQWLIHGVVQYRPYLAVESKADIEDEARRELLSAVTRASRSARGLGARSVYVTVDGDDEIAGFFRMLRRAETRRAGATARRAAG